MFLVFRTEVSKAMNSGEVTLLLLFSYFGVKDTLQECVNFTFPSRNDDFPTNRMASTKGCCLDAFTLNGVWGTDETWRDSCARIGFSANSIRHQSSTQNALTSLDFFKCGCHSLFIGLEVNFTFCVNFVIIWKLTARYLFQQSPAARMMHTASRLLPLHEWRV